MEFPVIVPRHWNRPVIWKWPPVIDGGLNRIGCMPTLGTLLTFTTYGTWLRGDARGWIDDGVLMPPDPVLETADRGRMAHPPFLFAPDALLALGVGLRDRQRHMILAL